MKIILLKDVKKIGRKYDIKEVSDGYALNMLIPNGMAISATAGNLNMIDVKRKREPLETFKSEAELETVLQGIKDITVEMVEKVNEKGHLFAGIHKDEIINALQKQKEMNISAEHLLLDKPIKEVGEHMISVKFGEKKATFKLIIKAK